MNLYTNHCWCSDSHRDGGTFDCRFILTIKQYTDEEHAVYKELRTEEFKKVAEIEEFTRQCEYTGREVPARSPNLKPEVLRWLEDNVGENFCIGSSEYRKDALDIRVFFKEEEGALNFIKEWSIHDLPKEYFNYFEDKVGDLVDGKLVWRDR